MTEILDAITQANALLAIVARCDRSALTDSEKCHLVVAEEQAARLVASSQAQSAAEIDHSSRPELGDDGLAMRNSFRRAVPFLEYLTRASQSDLAARVRLGHAIRDRVALTGELLPAAFPFVAEGVKSGQIAADTAAVIIRSLTQAANGSAATLERMDAAELALAELAASECADVVRAAARAWRDALDPDGMEPRYDEIVALRTLRKGREHNGITDWFLKADPRTTALLDAVLDEGTAPGVVPRFLSDGDRALGTSATIDEAGNEVLVLTDRRDRGQKQLDILVGVLTAGLRASHDAAPDLRSTGTVIATVTLADLEAGVGAGWLAGANEPLPIRAIEQLICDSGVKIMVLGKNGKPLYETVRDRYFTRAQRQAMLVRDGDRCAGPGCQTPAAWGDAHHVQFHEDGGPTALDNGVLLCGSCHTALHSGAFEIRMVDGIPYVRLAVNSGDETVWRRAGSSRQFGKAA